MTGNKPAPRRPECNQVLAFCRCVRRGPHQAHMCPCGGSWSGPEGDETILALPQRLHPRIVLVPPLEKTSTVLPPRDDGPLPKETA